MVNLFSSVLSAYLTGFMYRFEIKKNRSDKHPTSYTLNFSCISPELVSQLPCIPFVSDFVFVAVVPVVEWISEIKR